MSRSLLIAGVERWGDIVDDELSIEKGLTYDSDNCRFELSGDEPNVGDGVIISDTALGNIFGGIIVKIDTNFHGSPDNFRTWSVECDDYSAVLDRRLVVESYSAQTAAYIIEDIITKYVDTGFTSSIASGSPTIESITFDYVPVSECLKELADYVGWAWTISPTKVISFYNPEVLLQPGPIQIVPGAAFNDLKFNINTTNLRNRVYVKGGSMLSNYTTYEYKADGVATSWPLPYSMVDASIEVGGVSKTLGVENLHKPEDYDYLFNYNEPRLLCGSGTSAPADGTTISLTFKYYIDVITMAEDLASQAAIAAVQGNDGVYEYVISDDALVTLEAAEAAGQQDIRENGNPTITGSFNTLVGVRTYLGAWEPGQIVTINLPAKGITNRYMVRKVNLELWGVNDWLYKISFGGRLIGIDDFLKALVNNQKSAASSDTSTVMKYVYGDETVAVTDALYTTPRTTPYIIEASASGVVSTA